MVACFADADGAVFFRGVVGGRGRRVADCGAGGRDLSTRAARGEAMSEDVAFDGTDMGTADGVGIDVGAVAGTGFLEILAVVAVSFGAMNDSLRRLDSICTSICTRAPDDLRGSGSRAPCDVVARFGGRPRPRLSVWELASGSWACSTCSGFVVGSGFTSATGAGATYESSSIASSIGLDVGGGCFVFLVCLDTLRGAAAFRPFLGTTSVLGSGSGSGASSACTSACNASRSASTSASLGAAGVGSSIAYASLGSFWLCELSFRVVVAFFVRPLAGAGAFRLSASESTARSSSSVSGRSRSAWSWRSISSSSAAFSASSADNAWALSDACDALAVALAVDALPFLAGLTGASSISSSCDEAGGAAGSAAAFFPRAARFLAGGASALVMTESSMASLARLRPRAGFAGGSGMWSGSSSKISTASSFLALVFRGLAVVVFLALVDFFPPCVMVDAVVMTLSSWLAVMSARDWWSVATVATDWPESREAFEALAVLVALAFLGGGSCDLRMKKGQSEERL